MATDSTDGSAAGLSDGAQAISETSPVSARPDSAGTVSNGSDRRIDGAEGNDATQLSQASAIALMPKAGEWVVIRVEAGDRVEFPFSLAGAESVLKDGNIELHMPNGGVVVLQGYLAAIEGEPALQLTDANGEVVDLEDFIVAIDELEELGLLPTEVQEEGAQPATEPVHDGGANFSPADPVTILDGLQEEGALLGTALLFEQESFDDRKAGIEDDDRGPTDLIWSISGESTVTEGTTGSYTVSYTGADLAPGQTVTIAVATGGGFDSGINDAGSGVDLQPVNAILTFTGGGATAQTLSVTIFSDTILEGSEDYTVTIGSQTAGTVTTSQANTVIADDDGTSLVWHIGGGGPAQGGAPITNSGGGGGGDEDGGSGGGGGETLGGGGSGDSDGGSTGIVWSINGVNSVQENAGTALYTISYTGPTLTSGQTALVTVGTGVGADALLPNATSPGDFGAVSTVLTFTSGTGTTRTMSVTIVNDGTAETAEDYSVTIGGVSTGQIGTGQANTVIEVDPADGQPAPIWSIAGTSSVEEGNAAIYTVGYAGGPITGSQTVLITVGTAGGGFTGTLTDAVSPSDFGAVSTVLTFTRGTGTAQTIQVTTIDNGVGEGSEDYRVTISGQSSGTLGTTQANTIITEEAGTQLEWSINGQAAVTEGGTAVYTVSYDGPNLSGGQTALVTVGTATGGIATLPNATAGLDFGNLSTILTFTAGSSTSRTVGVTTINDAAAEAGEDYSVRITGVSQGVVTASSVDTVISIDPADGDVPLIWNVTGDSVVNEGGFANYTVSYTGDRLNEGETATVVVNTGTGFTGTLTDATANIDYGSLTTTLTFTAGGKAAQTFRVSTVTDTLVEGDEDYTVRITSTSTGTSNLSQVNTVIDDQVTGPDIDWHITGDPIAGEMNGVARYTVGYTGDPLAPGQTATVTVGTGSGGWTSTLPDAIAGGDYTGLNTVLTFTGGGVTQRTVGVSIIFDTLPEGQEDYTVTIGGASAGTVVTSQANTVIDQVNNATTVDEDQGPAVYTIWYTGAAIAPGVTATIAVATGGGFTGTLNDATGGTDYTSVMTTLTFTGGGPTFQTIAVSLIDDTLLEGDEDYNVTIGNQSDGSIGTSQSNTVIVDDEASSLVWNIVGASQVTEGDTGTYTVSYTGAAIAPGQTALVTVRTGIADVDPNDATPNVDYTSLTTVLTFTGGGVTSRTVAVSTVEDTFAEPTEDYQVEISSNAGTIGNGEQHTNIVDDDGTSLVWSIGPSAISVDEAEHEVATVSYTGAPIAPGFTALVTVSTGGGWGTFPDATAGVDFTAFTTTLTFTSGTGTTQTLGLSTIGDTIVEGTEDYTITIGGVSHGSVGASQSNVSIIDDDGSNLVWNVLGSSTVTEGGTGSYTVSYTGATLAPGLTATIVVASANAAGGSPNATAGVDYTALAATTLTFTGGGVTQRTVPVSTIQDTIIEGTEDYAVILGNQSTGVLGSSQATTDIVDNDASLLSWTIVGSTQVGEGSAALYTVSYTGATLAPGQQATIVVSTANLAGGNPDATAGVDYGTVTTTLTFTGGSATTRTLQVTTVNDTIVESTEDYRVTLSGQSSGTISTSQANTNITDNDGTAINWQINGTTAVGEGGNAVYSVTLNGVTLAAGQTATVTVATSDLPGGSPNATAGADYTALTTVLTFTAGTGSERTVAVSTIVDTALEGTEDYRVTLSGQSSGTISVSQADTVIVDVSGDFRINEVGVGAAVTAPGGVATNHWIELRNTAGNAQLTTSISVEIQGATGGVKTVVLPGGLSVPSGGFVVLYEQGADARYGVYNSAGVLQSSGAIAGGGSWNFGTNTAQRVGVNIVASGASTDLFIANGATPGSFTGSPTWTSPGLSGSGFAAAAGLFSGDADLITEQASYNGIVDSQTSMLQRLGLRAGPVSAGSNTVFARVDTADDSNGTDWTTTNLNGDSAGALNNANYTNPNDLNENIVLDQATATAGEGQNILQRPDGSAGVLDGLLGNDYLYGGTNIDTLIGGGGDDFLFGHSGNDRLFGGPGSDVLVDVSGTAVANAGEYMEGGTGHDILLGTFGGSANTAAMLLVGDVSLASSPTGNDWIAGGNAFLGDTIIGDNIDFAAFSQATFLANPFAVGQPINAFNARSQNVGGSDTLFGFGGNDLIGGGGGIDSILGGTGEDTIYGDAEGDVLQGEDGSDSITGGAGADQIWGDESDGGGTGDDTLFGDAGADGLFGGAGFDLVRGNTGNDYLEGNIGNDTLHGGINDDTLVGGPGIDLYGLEESGGVLFDFSNAAPAPGGWQTMNLTAYGLGVDWFREMEGVAGSGGADTIIDGIGGGQYYQGNGGNDSYSDGAGQDTYDMSGGPGDHDTLSLPGVGLLQFPTYFPNSVLGFGTSFDATPPDTGDQDYINIDQVFDALGVSSLDRVARTRVFDPGPGPAPVELQIDLNGSGNWATLIIFEGHTGAGGFSWGNSASDDIQIGTL